MRSPRQSIRFCTSHDGTRIAFAESGDGPPLIKAANWLSHLEFDWNSPVWRHWLVELSRTHRLVRYDERGCGLSDWNVEDLSFEAWLRDLELVVDATGVHRFPLLVDAEAHENGLGRKKPGVPPVLHVAFHPRRFPVAAALVQRAEAHLDLASERCALHESADRNRLEALLPRVACPTLNLHLTHDAAVPFEEGRLMASRIPGARFVPLESANHLTAPFLDHVDFTEKFLNSAYEAMNESTEATVAFATAGQANVAKIAAAQVAGLQEAWTAKSG